MSRDPLETTSISLAEVLQRLSASRRLVPALGALGLALGIAAWLVLPRTYVSEATLLPSSGDDGGALPGGLAGLAGTLGISLPGASVPESHLFPTIMKSERVLRQALATPIDPEDPEGRTLYDLVQDPDDREAVRLERSVARLRHEIIRIGLDEETGIVRLSVFMGDPAMAHRTAEILLSELSDYLRHERTAQSRENREFVEGRRDEAAASLKRAEDRLSKFREVNRRITNSPDLMLEQERIFRDVKVQEEVFLELTRQYELARIEEQKATPVLEVLDPPTMHYAPKDPKLPILAGMGLLTGLFLGSLIAVVFESPKRALTGAWAGAQALLGRH